jgi:hypothetical protein
MEEFKFITPTNADVKWFDQVDELAILAAAVPGRFNTNQLLAFIYSLLPACLLAMMTIVPYRCYCIDRLILLIGGPRAALPNGTLCVPVSPFFPTIDCLVQPDKVYQCTVSSSKQYTQV